MKLKIYYLLLLFVAITLASCSKEETTTPSDNQNLIIHTDISTRTASTNNSSDRSTCMTVCDPNYLFLPPDPNERYKIIYITYDPDEIDESDIVCVRYQYFDCFSLLDLRFPIIQSTDPWNEIWKIGLNKPGSDLQTTICDDPRTTNPDCEL